MGFTIMESFMDELKVRSTPGKGTTVTMRRQIARRISRLNGTPSAPSCWRRPGWG